MYYFEEARHKEVAEADMTTLKIDKGKIFLVYCKWRRLIRGIGKDVITMWVNELNNFWHWLTQSPWWALNWLFVVAADY